MTRDPDAYAIWGDWDLHEFKNEIARWRDGKHPCGSHPPDDAVDTIKQWWRRLRQPMEWAQAVPVSREMDPDGTLRWMWVPEARWLDEATGYFRVQCYFRVLEQLYPPRLRCERFRTVQAMTAIEVDLDDGMG